MQAQYLLDPETGETSGIRAMIDGQAMTVPIAPGNRHYAEIMAAVQAGTLTVAPADPPPAAARMISAEAFWGVVDDIDGLRDQIDAAVEAIPDELERRAMRAVMRRRSFHYDSPSMATMRELIGMDQATFDALWVQGEQLQMVLGGID